jgi:ketosteroid isomerase-like protein
VKSVLYRHRDSGWIEIGGDSEVTMREFEEALRRFDEALRSGQAQDILDFLAEDCRAFIHHQATIEGREAVGEAFQQFFGTFDISVYEPDYDVVDVIGDQVYVLGSFHEVLRPREGRSTVQVFGRVVLFWRRIGGEWLMTRLLTARSAPDQVQD